MKLPVKSREDGHSFSSDFHVRDAVTSAAAWKFLSDITLLGSQFNRALSLGCHQLNTLLLIFCVENEVPNFEATLRHRWLLKVKILLGGKGLFDGIKTSK